MEVILAGGFGHNVEVILGEADELTRAAETISSGQIRGSCRLQS